MQVGPPKGGRYTIKASGAISFRARWQKLISGEDSGGLHPESANRPWPDCHRKPRSVLSKTFILLALLAPVFCRREFRGNRRRLPCRLRSRSEGPLHPSPASWSLLQGKEAPAEALESHKDRGQSRATGVPRTATRFLTALTSCAIVAGPYPGLCQLYLILILH